MSEPDIRLYYLGLETAEESKRRIANRVERGGHDIPADDVERRFSMRWDALKAVLPYCNEAAFYDNNNGFEEVVFYRNGELILEGDYHPQWIKDLERELQQ